MSKKKMVKAIATYCEPRREVDIKALTPSELIEDWAYAWSIEPEENQGYFLAESLKVSEIMSNKKSFGKINDETNKANELFQELNTFQRYVKENNISQAFFSTELEKSVRRVQSLISLNDLIKVNTTGKNLPEFTPMWSKDYDLKPAWSYMNDQLSDLGWAKGRLFEEDKVDWIHPLGERALIFFLILLGEYNHNNFRFIREVTGNYGHIYRFAAANFTYKGEPIDQSKLKYYPTRNRLESLKESSTKIKSRKHDVKEIDSSLEAKVMKLLKGMETRARQ